MFKFLPGIFFLQLVTVGLVLAAIKWLDNQEIVFVIIFFGFIVTLLTTFWFSAIARDIHKDALTKTMEAHAKEREGIKLSAEREKANIQSDSYKRIEKESKRVHAKANFKVGAAFALAGGAGAVMVMTQFVTMGLMLLVASGSGLAGYLTRLRQERLALSRSRMIDVVPPLMEQGEIPKLAVKHKKNRE